MVDLSRFIPGASYEAPQDENDYWEQERAAAENRDFTVHRVADEAPDFTEGPWTPAIEEHSGFCLHTPLHGKVFTHMGDRVSLVTIPAEENPYTHELRWCSVLGIWVPNDWDDASAIQEVVGLAFMVHT